MKTLLFCNLIPRKMGAYETLLAAIGSEFKKAGDEYVVVFSGEPIPPVAKSLCDRGVRWHVMTGWVAPFDSRPPDRGEVVRAWHFVLPAIRLIRLERPDVVAVHFGNELPTLAASLLCKLTMWKPPRWVWEQDQQIRDPGRLGRWISKIRLLGLGVNRFLVAYEGGRQSLLMRGIPANKIAVIHNAVAPYTLTRQKGWLRKELNIDSADVMLVTNGSLIPRKRIDFIIRVCAGLSVENPHVQGSPLTPEPLGPVTPAKRFWSLLIIGDGPERQRLVALAGELGIDDRIRLLGLRNDVREILSECDIYLHASRAETCTYAVTESLAAGIPAVMLNAGAAYEQIENGVSGYVLEEAVTGPFVSCLEALMGDPVRRMEMGRQAHSRWEAYFQVNPAATKYHSMYDAMATLGFR